MPWVDLAQFDDEKTDIVDADGVKGYLIHNHWTAWVPFWIVGPLVTLLCVYGVWAAKHYGVLMTSGAAALWNVLGAAFIVWLVVHVDLIWYRKLADTFLLVTEKNVFVSRMEHWFFNVIDGHPLGECTITTHSASWILPSVRSVEVRVEGQTIMHINRAAGGPAIEHAIETLRGARS
jgi:hypothetical protein